MECGRAVVRVPAKVEFGFAELHFVTVHPFGRQRAGLKTSYCFIQMFFIRLFPYPPSFYIPSYLTRPEKSLQV